MQKYHAELERALSTIVQQDREYSRNQDEIRRLRRANAELIEQLRTAQSSRRLGCAPRSTHRFVVGALRTLGIILTFAACGLLYAAFLTWAMA